MKKILVVEDESNISGIYSTRLTKLGYEVALASNGQEALLQLGVHTFDLILLDLIMPVMNGFELLERIRSDARLNTIPVIITSNVGDSDEVRRAIELGACDYLIKSDISLEDLAEKLELVLMHPKQYASMSA